MLYMLFKAKRISVFRGFGFIFGFLLVGIISPPRKQIVSRGLEALLKKENREKVQQNFQREKRSGTIF